MARIIGIVLVRNEDAYIENVLRNIIDFCDRIIVVDHSSTDGTAAKISKVAAISDKVETHCVADVRISHDLLRPYVGSDHWIFGVDGDELYDPDGLLRLREEVLSGKYEKWWTVFGNVLNCIEIDRSRMLAKGYMAPPCRSMTKLFNFNAITEWDGNVRQRLHGGHIVFRKGYDAMRRLELHQTLRWEESYYRCLHMCFVPRSSLAPDTKTPRLNISESYRWGRVGRVWRRVGRMFGVTDGSRWKTEKYMRGKVVAVDATPFLTCYD